MSISIVIAGSFCVVYLVGMILAHELPTRRRRMDLVKALRGG